jgi:hypothetical protein
MVSESIVCLEVLTADRDHSCQLCSIMLDATIHPQLPTVFAFSKKNVHDINFLNATVVVSCCTLDMRPELVNAGV